MSEGTDIISEPRVAPPGEECPDEYGNYSESPSVINGETDSLPRLHDTADAIPTTSPRQQSKKRKNKCRKSNKVNGDANVNGNPKVRPEEDGVAAQIVPKEGKTKMNMERRRELTTVQTTEEKNGGKIEKEKSEAENGVNKDDEDCLDIPAPDQLDGPARNQLYQRGLAYVNKGQENLALRCFTACLTGLASKEGFAFLPQCLKHMADIYYSQEEYEKAIQFVQAEKMYYETALIHTSELQKDLETNMKQKTDSTETEGQEGQGQEDHRADEYENLARLCLDKKQAELALEYQGKATQLRQKTFGVDHPLTKKSLDFFTVIYAEVGKQQYSESLQKFSDKSPGGSTTPESAGGEGDADRHLRRRKSGILRSSSQTEELTKNKERRVHFQEPEQIVRNRQRREEELWVSQTILWVLGGLSIALLTCMLGYLYCHLDLHSHTCLSWRAQVNYYYMRVKYFYYTWNANPSNKFG